MKKLALFSLLVFYSLLTVCPVQAVQSVRVVFYNVENYFDCEDDSLKQDEDFLPGGAYKWNLRRFWHKTEQLAKVLALAGEGGFPHLVGLAEVENEGCLRNLLFASSLRNASYRYVYAESADLRGIDVCLLYNRFVFKPLNVESIRPIFADKKKKTRDILYVYGQLAGKEFLHVFVCHLPSRYGGVKASEGFRREVAKRLRSKVDSIFSCNTEAKILIMGDFNDEPDDLSLSVDLGAISPQCPFRPATLYNLMWPYLNKPDLGSHKYQGQWSVIDQIVVSTSLLYKTPASAKKQAQRCLPQATILFDDILLEVDKKYLGFKPFRTYEGYRYSGGFSDHLPVCLDIPF